MWHVLPGDVLVIGGGLFRTVQAVHLSQDTQTVTLRASLPPCKEIVSMLDLQRHIETGFVIVRRDS